MLCCFSDVDEVVIGFVSYGCFEELGVDCLFGLFLNILLCWLLVFVDLFDSVCCVFDYECVSLEYWCYLLVVICRCNCELCLDSLFNFVDFY